MSFYYKLIQAFIVGSDNRAVQRTGDECSLQSVAALLLRQQDDRA